MPPACHSLPHRRFATLKGAALRGEDFTRRNPHGHNRTHCRGGGRGDLRQIKDALALLKELTSFTRELGGGASSGVTVRFDDAAADAAK